MRVATFNLYDLVRPGVTYRHGHRYSSVDYERKVRWIAGQLAEMDADVVGFQEIFHRAALDDALSRTDRGGYEYVVVEGETGETPVVGLASRYPLLEEPASHVAIPSQAQLACPTGDVPITRFSRPVLECVLMVPELGPTIVFVAHLKSKRVELLENEDPASFLDRAKGEARALARRAAEAVGLRHLLLQSLAGHRQPVILLGDLGDDARSVSSGIVAGEPPLGWLDSERKRRTWDVLLYDAAALGPRRSLDGPRYTHVFNGFHERLDHIYLSEEFVRANPAHLAEVRQVHFYTDHLVDEGLAPHAVPRWKSDHGQVVATLRIRRERPPAGSGAAWDEADPSMHV